jgi:hypothetical protein
VSVLYTRERILNANPPKIRAKAMSTIIIAKAFLHPNSLAQAAIVETHGIYIIMTNEKTIICIAVKDERGIAS